MARIQPPSIPMPMMTLQRFVRSSAVLAVLSVLLAATAALGVGCGADSSSRPATPARPLPAWQGRMAELFDDRIDRAPSTSDFGLADSKKTLWERTEASDFVIRIKVRSLTSEGSERYSRSQLGVAIQGDPIVGERPPWESIELTVGPTSPALAVIRLLDMQLVNQTFVMFFKRFSGASGEEPHWYMTVESPALIRTVQEAHLLSEVRAAGPK